MKILHFSQHEPFFDSTLSIRGLGLWEVMPAGQVNRPGGADCWLLVQFHDPAEVELVGRSQHAQAGSVCVLRPGTPHRFGDHRQPWAHCWILMDGTHVASAVARSRLATDVLHRLEPGTLVLRYLNGIYTELWRQASPRRDMLADWISLLLRELARAVGADGAEATIPPALREVRQYMETRLDRPLGLGQLARWAHLSVSQFSAAFRRYYGEAPIRYLLGLRMRRAALLLADPSLSVGDVASAVGVSDPLYFSRLFRRHWGVSPTSYRRGAAGS